MTKTEEKLIREKLTNSLNKREGKTDDMNERGWQKSMLGRIRMGSCFNSMVHLRGLIIPE